MSLFTNLFTGKTGAKSASSPETAPVKMNLEERMAFRREMLYECIKATLQSRQLYPNAYRFRVVRSDKRGHQYAVMIDLASEFLHRPEGQQEALLAVSGLITRNALARYGLGVTGVYWRIDEQMTMQEASRRSAPDSMAPETGAAPLTPREKYEQATAEELAAFEAAWQRNQDVQVGSRVYSSDLAPLAADPPARGSGR